MKITPIIMSGGSGKRLWPLSRQSYPKQFLKIFDGQSLFQQTCKRLDDGLFTPPIVLGNFTHRFMMVEQLRDMDMDNSGIVLEPDMRDTAPAALMSALIATQTADDALLLLLPSDHYITDPEAFRTAIKKGIPAAEQGSIVTFGIKPDKPHTGYGYIKSIGGADDASDVETFVEKPDMETAQTYLEDGNYLWNAGIFLFTATTLISNFEKHAQDLLEPCRDALSKARIDLDFLVLDLEAYSTCRSISLDHAIMEKSDNIACVPLDIGWNDVGSWSAFWDLLEKDANGNASRGDVVLNDATNCLAYSEGRLLALSEVEDLCVVATDDVVLVLPKNKVESVKQVVELLIEKGRSETTFHNRVYRPWGWFEQLGQGDRFQVKTLMVKPGEKLSLQKHHHRSEHWVVVTGTVEVTVGNEVMLLSENQSTYIPLGARHRLHNPGKLDAYLIEVQSGAYLGEDDIVRIEDDYNRSKEE